MNQRCGQWKGNCQTAYTCDITAQRQWILGACNCKLSSDKIPTKESTTAVQFFSHTSLCCAEFDIENLRRTLPNVAFVHSVHWLAQVQFDFANDRRPTDCASHSEF